MPALVQWFTRAITRPPGQQQAQAHRCCHAAQIKHVLGKALIPAHPLGHRLDDAVPRVGDQPHVDGEGHPHPRQHDGQGQHRQIFRQAVGRRLIGDAGAAQIQQPAEHQAQGKSQQCGQPLPPLPEKQLHHHKDPVEHKGHVAEIQLKDLGHTVGH